MEKLKIIESELVPVYETDKGQKVVYGTELFACLGSKRQYTDWIKERFSDCDAEENKDFQSFSQKNEKGGRPKTEYIIQLATAKEMAMLERNDKGKQVRRYFIKVEEKYKEITAKNGVQQSYWQQTRQQTRESRLLETECIKEFVVYAKGQGSQHAERYYCSFTRLANKAAGIDSSRENATVQQLNNLSLIEHIIEQVLRECMQQEKPYKEVYLACKARVEQFQEIAYLSTERAIRRNP